MISVVIIPAYNPDEALVRIVKELSERRILPVVVDDGSEEESQKIFDEICEECIILHHEKNKGKGAAVKSAMSYIKGELWGFDTIGIMDADGQHRTEDMARLLDFSRNHRKALSLGVRAVGKDIPLRSRMGNTITRKVFRLVSGKEVSDTQTGLRAFDTELLQALMSVKGERYEYEMNMLLECADRNIPIKEMKIETIYHDEDNSCSHFRTVRDSFRIYREIMKFICSFKDHETTTEEDYNLGRGDTII